MLMLWLACAAPPPPDAVFVGDVVGVPGVAGRHALVLRGGEVAWEEPGEGVAAALITPGMVDAHGHPASFGRKLDEIDLTGTVSLAAALDVVRGRLDQPGWLTGRGWDQNDWPGQAWPTAADLDAVAGDRPAALRRVDGHAIWVDSAVLRLAGIDATTPDPPGGRILRDAAGAPTGVLVDNAVDLVKLPDPDAATRRRRIEAALAGIAAEGLTGVHAMGESDADLAIYEALAAEDRLPVRVVVYVPPEGEAAKRLLATGPWTVGRLAVVGVKAYADGALGSRGALLSADYTDEPGHRGTAIVGLEALTDLATRCLAARAQLAVHAIGDAGVKNALDAFTAARAAHPEAADVRLRVEHAQVVHPDDRARFAALGVVASMQPTHATSDGPWAEARLGPDRIAWSYAWRSLADAGAPLAFGSDFPIESLDPGFGLYAATKRRDPTTGWPEGGWRPEEAVTLAAAIAAFSGGANAAAGQPAAPADFTVWTEVDGRYDAIATVVDGRVVWRADGPAGPKGR